jgi:hypothetical protein
MDRKGLLTPNMVQQERRSLPMYHEEYVTPLMEVIHFENEDIITTSGGSDFGLGGGEGEADTGVDLGDNNGDVDTDTDLEDVEVGEVDLNDSDGE